MENPLSWEAYPCNDYKNCENGKTTACVGECPSMGYGADKTKPTGKFYLKTSAKAPFHGMCLFVLLDMCRFTIKLPWQVTLAPVMLNDSLMTGISDESLIR